MIFTCRRSLCTWQSTGELPWQRMREPSRLRRRDGGRDGRGGGALLNCLRRRRRVAVAAGTDEKLAALFLHFHKNSFAAAAAL